MLLLGMQQSMQGDSAHTAATVHRAQMPPPPARLANQRKTPHARAAEPPRPAGTSADAMCSTGAHEVPAAEEDWLVAADRAARGVTVAAMAGMAMVGSPSRRGEELAVEQPEQLQSLKVPASAGASRWRIVLAVT